MAGANSRAALNGCCPEKSCNRVCTNWGRLLAHWKAHHEGEHGPIHQYIGQMQGESTCDEEREDVARKEGDEGVHDGVTVESEGEKEEDADVQKLLREAMSHIDEMKFRYYQTDAQVHRAKVFARDIIRDCVAPAVSKRILNFIQENPSSEVHVDYLIKPIMSALDEIVTEKNEKAYRWPHACMHGCCSHRCVCSQERLEPACVSCDFHVYPVCLPL